MNNWQKIFKENKSLLALVLVIGVLFGGASGAFFSSDSVGALIQKGKSSLGQSWSLDNPTNEFGIPSQVYNVEEESQTVSAVEKISPSVVSIIITKDLSKYYNATGPNIFPFDDFFDFGFGLPSPRVTPQPNQPNKQEVGGGTGFFISEDGLILTNKHVVSDEDAEYSVLTNDGKRYDAQVLARDPSNDIAVVKIINPDKKFVPAELGDSDKIKIGQTAIAIGNSLGEYRNTVTKGVISGIGRRVTAGDRSGRSEVIEEALQTDAAINPGNSGGPLINIAGQVIGVNTAVSLSGQLIGFAIPINQAKQDIESVIKLGKIVRPFLGVRYVLINEQIAKQNKLSVNHGALVLRGDQPGQLAVVPGGPADKAGIVENDIILEIGGQKVDVDHQLSKIVSKYKPGDEVEMKILHRGETKKIKVKLGEFND